MKRWSLFALMLFLSIGLAACAGEETPPVNDDDVPGGEVEVGGDWRTWRSYSDELAINEEVAVLLSNLDEGTGLAVYDINGARIGNLLFAAGGDYTLDDTVAWWNCLTIDLDEDGNKEIGVEMTDGAVLWYGYAPDAEAWPENSGGVFAYVRTDTPGHPITAPMAEVDALVAALGSKLEGRKLLDQGTEEIDGVTCRVFALGTDTAEKFTAEEHYAVSPAGDIYYIDVLQGADWLPFES